jgi:hypothetical protein
MKKKLKCHCPSIVHPFPMSHSDCFVVKTTHFSGQLTGSSPSSSARKRSNGCGSKNSSRSYGRAIGKTRDGWGYGMKNGSGWWFEPLRKIWKSVGSFLNISQLGWLSHILWKIKNVWNHQPAICSNIRGLPGNFYGFCVGFFCDVFLAIFNILEMGWPGNSGLSLIWTFISIYLWYWILVESNNGSCHY